MHDYLHRSRWLGDYIRRYESKQGISWLSKLTSMTFMWIMVSISTFCFIENPHLRILVLVLGIIGTCSILFIVPTRKKSENMEN